ncbi:hypothetical protein HRbin27_00051 [bacterium HR27]|nr:hypothetical protein HRbin27_00051 [bacterium HR27]
MQNANGPFWILKAGQLDEDLVVPTCLDDWFADAEAVDAPLDRITGAFEDLLRDCRPSWRSCLENELDATLEIETLPDSDVPLPTEGIERSSGQIDPDGGEAQDDDEEQCLPRSDAHCSLYLASTVAVPRDTPAIILLALR